MINIETTSVAAAGEVQTCHQLLQMSKVAIYVYLALQLMHDKGLLMKFQVILNP